MLQRLWVSTATLIDQRWRKYVSLIQNQKAIVNRKHVREVQIAAAGGATERSLQPARAKGNILLRIREEESD